MTEIIKHLLIRPLSLEDEEEVLGLEKVGFPPGERCSKETLRYRLKACPELTSGLFIRQSNPTKSLDSYKPEESITTSSEKLIGYILATKIDGEFITEESMSYPDSDLVASGAKKGHVESSNVIGIHSVVVHPEFQKKNLATLLLRDFKQKLANQRVGSQVSLISKPQLIKFYERLRFINRGKSNCQHGGEDWFNLQCDLDTTDEE